MTGIMGYIRERQTLLTVFAVLIIVFGGIQMVDNPERWWIPPVALLSVLTVILLFIYARVALKAVASFTVMSFCAYFAFITGGLADGQGLVGILFSLSICMVFFLDLSLSYLTPSLWSRWTVSGATSVLQFFSTNALFIGAEFIDPKMSVAIGTVAGVGIFFAFYKIPLLLAYRDKKMPANIASDDLTESLQDAFTSMGWNFLDMREKGNKGGYLVFKDRAYYIHPMRMTQDFQEYKKTQLRYQGKPIQKWLLSVFYRDVPSFRTKGAPIMPVLLDLNSSNGSVGKVIGATIVDSRRHVPFGIFPGRELNSNRAVKTPILETLEERFSPFTPEMSQKHKSALAKIAGIPGSGEGEDSNEGSEDKTSTAGEGSDEDSGKTADTVDSGNEDSPASK